MMFQLRNFHLILEYINFIIILFIILTLFRMSLIMSSKLSEFYRYVKFTSRFNDLVVLSLILLLSTIVQLFF